MNFTTELGQSYNCSKQTQLKMDNVTITLSHLRLEAFKDDKRKTPSFSTTGLLLIFILQCMYLGAFQLENLEDLEAFPHNCYAKIC